MEPIVFIVGLVIASLVVFSPILIGYLRRSDEVIFTMAADAFELYGQTNEDIVKIKNLIK